MPLGVTLPLPEMQLVQFVRLRGVFGIFAKSSREPGGLEILLMDGPRLVDRYEVHADRHFLDSEQLEMHIDPQGDGIAVTSVGCQEVSGARHRLDEIWLERLKPDHVTDVIIQSLGRGSASILLQVEVGEPAPRGCPFHSDAGGVPLSEIGAIIRNRDRALLRKAIDQMREGLLAASDLDEARGQGLTFLAVVTAATLEVGASRDMHRIQLEAARSFDALDDVSAIADRAESLAIRIVDPLLSQTLDPSRQWVEKALVWIDRHFAQDFSDADLADMVGLSRSHFRFLFQEVTGQPFHRFVVSKRLEKAHALIVDQGMSVNEAANAVGFGSASHFSRAFTKRFSVNPNKLRKVVR